MPKRYLEAGKIINTHGVRGELKIQPWANGPEFLKGFRTFYIDGKPFKILSAKVHKGCLIALFEGIDDLDKANLMRNKIIFIDREDARLEPGEYFLQDVVGLDAVNDDTGEKIGVVSDILDMPSSDVFVIKGDREILVPNVPEFVKAVSVADGTVRVKLIEGM